MDNVLLMCREGWVVPVLDRNGPFFFFLAGGYPYVLIRMGSCSALFNNEVGEVRRDVLIPHLWQTRKGVVMEHRWGVRRQAALAVAIFSGGRHVAQCQSRDIGRGGVFVLGKGFEFQKNTPLEVEIVFDNSESLVRFHLHAYVAHIAEDGMGLMFKRTRAGVSQALMEILSCASVEYAWKGEAGEGMRGSSYLPLHPSSLGGTAIERNTLGVRSGC